MLTDRDLPSANAALVGRGTGMRRYTPPRLQGGVNATANMLLTGPQTASIALGARLIAVLDYRILLLLIFAGMAASGAVLLFRPARPRRAVEHRRGAGRARVRIVIDQEVRDQPHGGRPRAPDQSKLPGVHTVAVLSLKGGVGKTTVVLGLASAALRRGVRTLVVDLDPQCNSTATLDPAETEGSLVEVLARPGLSTLRSAVAPSPWGEGVDVLVGSEEVEALNHPEPNSQKLGKLGKALELVNDLVEDGDPAYQLVLLDCPPSLGQLTRSALVAADRALLVTEPTMFAVSGVQRAFEAVQNERELHNPRLQPLGVVVNRVRPRSHEHQFRIEELRELFGPLVMPVALPDRLAVQQAQGACMPIHQWNTPGAREVSLAFNLLLARILRAGRGRRVAREPEEDFD